MSGGGPGHPHVVTPCSFRDGRDYVVSVSVHEKPKSVVILISDKITAEEWSCHYDLKSIEDLTQRTGNYKPFDTFVTMLKCGILKNSDAVTLDLKTYEDLKAEKTKRHLARLVATSDLNHSDQSQRNLRDRNQAALSKRKYLIVTYVTEFDTVHYPVPLVYSGPPDPLVMQNNIKRLQAEVSQLKSANLELSGKLGQDQRQDWNGDELNGNSGVVGSYAAHHRAQLLEQAYKRSYVSEPEPEEAAMDIDPMTQLLTSMNKLEERIEKERAEHAEEMERVEAENAYLRDKIEELVASVQLLNQEISRLQAQRNGCSVAREESRKSSPSARCEHERFCYREEWKKVPQRQSPYATPVRLPRARSILRNGRKERRSRPSSTASVGFQVKRATPRPRSRSLSPAPVSVFDATAYVRGQKLRQQEIDRIRLSEIKANFSGTRRPVRRSLSRGRSVSFDDRNSVRYVTDYEKEEAGDGTRRSGVHGNLRSFSRSPPRNTEARAIRRLNNILEAEKESLGLARGRTIERRLSSRKLPPSAGKKGKAGPKPKALIKVKKRTKSKEAFAQTRTMSSDLPTKTDSMEVMYSEQEIKDHKMFRLPSVNENQSKTYILKDLESSLDALQKFINTTNEAYSSSLDNN